MSYRTIVINQIQVIGRIWQPCGVCAMRYDLHTHDIEQIKAMGDGCLIRDGVRRWLDTHAGDFQAITDFRADIENFLSDWGDPESEYTFLDCLYPAES